MLEFQRRVTFWHDGAREWSELFFEAPRGVEMLACEVLSGALATLATSARATRQQGGRGAEVRSKRDGGTTMVENGQGD